MERLARKWWVIAVRGVLAAAFGIALLAWPDITLPVVVVLFGAYALLDGGWTLASAIPISGRSIGRLAVAVEGIVSLTLGAAALAWPFVPREYIQLVAGWGVATGLLELITASTLPGNRAGYWLLGTAGICSLFLAVVVFLVPEADAALVAYAIGGYALAFGLVLTWTAIWFRGAYRVAMAPPARRWAA